ncbi:protein of unknown function [Shewanella benthica]|uniref:Uncharacterized protein n=1 Tax=Shewanella benthica TaxID=43661 RepID=A0A330M425_9GAMM|nr:protein of unknown function [Shewanella benthica]
MKVARWVLRRAALGNKCRLSDKSELLASKTQIEEATFSKQKQV